MSIIKIGYNITTDPTFLDKQNAITLELSRKLERFHKLAVEGKRSSVQKLLDAIDQYPDNPQLKNYLSVLYGLLNETEKMYDTNKWIIAEHPNYLFGKLNLAHEYYFKQEYDKMPEILGSAMELKALYPDRDTFHLNEVISFYKCATLYFTAIGDIEQAEIRYDIMQELAPDSEDTETARLQIFAATMKAGHERFEKEQKTRISVKTRSQKITSTNKAPNFIHEEIDWLYSHGLYIGEEKLNKILSLPKDSLINDLELVLLDSIVRYGYFKKLDEENGWDEEKMNFVVHAVYLLGELEAAECLETIFDVLSQSDAYFDLFLGDFLTSAIWEPIYKIAINDLEACKEFMYTPGLDTYARTTITDVLEQLALHHPERREEVLTWYRDVIQFFLDSSLEDNVIDSDVIALLICNVIDIHGAELLPEIEQLFERGLVSQGICGAWKEVKEAFEHPDTYDKVKEILPMADRYDIITSTWASYRDELSSPPADFFDFSTSSQMPVRAEAKIGRNDSCPCGSGKKYKKCCLNK
ncbi:SEC-C motif-containing protein [Arenibacter nanhaiticus]|uniref:SEC-C motif-containing protein n=1 Tax=Arenibacter nanhaiticus TaxID=558155 RepID=A0A1M6FBL2_9FLAO|nr:DUF1186 domain-containing protein [Arenibacter nanhaiticus]SHI95072.1 SEC-C motif-containing protein [Arenibacter nanhaiticus]